MRLFEYQVVSYKVLEDGFIIAEDRKEAETKLKIKEKEYPHCKVEIDDDFMGYDGVEIDENGIAMRWFD